MIALAKKTKPPVSMNIFLLNFLVTHDHYFKNRTGRTDRFNREPGASPVRLKPPNRSTTGQKPENRAKTGVEPEIKKKNGLMSGSVFKTMPMMHQTMPQVQPSTEKM